jgi:hypothetical protein
MEHRELSPAMAHHARGPGSRTINTAESPRQPQEIITSAERSRRSSDSEFQLAGERVWITSRTLLHEERPPVMLGRFLWGEALPPSSQQRHVTS